MFVEGYRTMIASPDRGEITRLIQQMPLLRSFIFNIAFHATNISLLTELKHILSFSILRSPGLALSTRNPQAKSLRYTGKQQQFKVTLGGCQKFCVIQ